MNLRISKLSSAVRLALPLGVVMALGATGTAFAQDATGGQEAKTLQSVVVTGSLVRRVDVETSSPVITIDRTQLQATGKQTVGDLVQQLPSIAGNATNPNVNNGGGTGASTVSLRGLGSNRTLILVNGHRVLNNDVNTIPASMVERVEVLKSGASAIYGSDAIGGVVNFILRNDFQGAQVSANFGESDHNDGEKKGFSATFGTASDKGNIIAGIDYNQTDGVSAGRRDWATNASYLSKGKVTNTGSSRNPNGRIYIPKNMPGYPAGGTSLTLAHPVPGLTDRSDYRTYNGLTDAYNYAAVNLITTPQERTNVFALANYNITPDVTAFMSAFYNKTTSNSQLAALPFDANTDGVSISKDNYYNPFGIDFGPGTDAAGNPTSNEFLTRFTNISPRIRNYSTTTTQMVAGLKGNFGDSSWQWSAALNYGHYSRQQTSPGYILYSGMKTALGPSFKAADGTITCGTPSAPIANCTPVNLFNLGDPATTAAMNSFLAAPFNHILETSRRVELNANGGLFELPGGTAQLAVGFDYDKEYQNNQVDLIAQTTGLGGTCQVSQETCGTPLGGSFQYKEAYFELFLPTLADVPFAKSLNVTIGSRFSRYSSVGISWEQKFGVEWRPVSDLLVRGTVSGVFRAPTITDLFAGAAGGAPQFQDPCIGYTGGHPNACANVPLGYEGTGLSQTTGVSSGSEIAGIKLKPEHGKTYDYGLVYSPSFIPGLSLTADLWRVTLDDTITNIGAQDVANICYANDASPFCSLIHRLPTTGDISFISRPTVNLGKLNTKGVDGGASYRIPHFDVFGQDWGDLTASVDATYLVRYNVDTAPGTAGDIVRHLAGHYNNQYGNYARWRGLGQLHWASGAWSVNYVTRYIGTMTVGWADPREVVSADQGIKGFELPISSRIYHDVSLGYNLAPYHTRLEFGVNNIADKAPPMLYQNNVINSNTDINTYDAIGRYFWGRVTVTF